MSDVSGNTNYGDNATYPEFSWTVVTGFTIDETGGFDSLSAVFYGGAQTIDLRIGHFSSMNGFTNNVFINSGVVENASSGNGNDTIIGNDANNSINPNGGNDTVDGGAGIDTVMFIYGNGVTVNLNTTIAQFISASQGTDTLTNFENIFGSAGADFLTGNGGSNEIWGAEASDFIKGDYGNDVLHGGSGTDIVRMGFASTHSWTYGSATITQRLVSLGNGQVLVGGSEGVDTIDGFEIAQYADRQFIIEDANAPLVDQAYVTGTYGQGGGAVTYRAAFHHTVNANAYFDAAGYVSQYGLGTNDDPLAHYIAHWSDSGHPYDPSVNFDTGAYLAANADVAAAGVNPLQHYLIFGINEGRSPQADGLWG